jgi:3-dehydroquinate synthase
LKADVVEKDEFDKLGIRNVLNFGHTIGHALELSAQYALTHGEAISIGMVAASRMAARMHVCSGEFVLRLEKLLQRAGLPLVCAGHSSLFDSVVRALQLDKKFRDGRNLFVLPQEPGAWRPVENIDWDIVHAAIRSALE